jgi:hypothetical protein
MPEFDGNVLPHEQQHFNLQGLERRQPLADELLDIGLKGLNRASRMPYSLEAHVFVFANKNYEEAVEAFRYGLNVASMVMVRTTIDASLYASKYTVIDKIEGFERRMGGSISFHNNCCKKRVEWKDLKPELKALGFNLKRRNELCRIRDRYGNLSAHNAARYTADIIKYASLSEEQRKRVKPPKGFISERDAYRVLKRTGRFLAQIRQTYAKKTLKTLNWSESSTHT